MEAAPSLIVHNSKNLSVKHALKSISKFLEKNPKGANVDLTMSISKRAGMVPEDILEKLSVIRNSLAASAGNEEKKVVNELVTTTTVEKSEKQDKSEKKNKRKAAAAESGDSGANKKKHKKNK